MTASSATPVLGILNESECPQARMLVVVWGKPDHLHWAYLTDFCTNHRGNYELNYPDHFTPLALFGCVAVMRPDGQLLVTQINISVAQYPDGKPRRWQGQPQETIIVRKHLAGDVIAALQAKHAKSEVIS